MGKPTAGILIDITRLLARALEGKIPTGVDRVGLCYIEHFRNRAQALVRFGGRWLVLSKGNSERLFSILLAPGKCFAWQIRYLVGRNYPFNWCNKSEGALLLNVLHSGLDDPAYEEEISKRKWKALFFLHDLIPVTHPEYCRAGEAEKHRRRVETMLSVGTGIIVNSQATLQVLEAYAAKRQLPPCLVAPLAAAQLPAASGARPLNQPYFVILGTIEPRKNHLLLLNIWRELVEALGDKTPKLVIIGRRGWECEQVEDMLDRCEKLRGVVIEKPDCNDAELSTWLHHARALLFPSFAEGFGIPVIEALAQSVPVIASDLPVFREIAGEIPDYASPIDSTVWKRLIMEYTSENSVHHAQQRQRMQGYTAPTWDAHFAAVETFLNRLL